MNHTTVFNFSLFSSNSLISAFWYWYFRYSPTVNLLVYVCDMRESSRNRTYNLLVKSQLLYRLSYGFKWEASPSFTSLTNWASGDYTRSLKDARQAS
jgi:hypothetical protein